MNTKNKVRRPWNAVAEQVYSLSSVSSGVINMNIATYVTAITMQPKRYCIAVYRGTQTHKNIYGTHTPFLLQSLTEAQAPLVRVLGKKSGTIYNKARYLTKKATKNIQAVPLAYHGSLAYLAESAFVLECIPEQYIDVGDHDLVIARVDTVLRNTPAQLLTTQYLQDTGLIL